MPTKITSEKAIAILRRQQSKIPSIKYNTDESFKNQLQSNIADYFGIDSSEYDFIKKFQFYDMGLTADASAHIKETSPEVFNFIENCIETIYDKGLYDPPKVNFLYRIKTEYLIAFILVLVPGLFGLGSLYGKYLSDAQNIELKIQVKELQEKLKLPLPVSKDTNNVSQYKRDTASGSR